MIRVAVAVLSLLAGCGRGEATQIFLRVDGDLDPCEEVDAIAVRIFRMREGVTSGRDAPGTRGDAPLLDLRPGEVMTLAGNYYVHRATPVFRYPAPCADPRGQDDFPIEIGVAPRLRERDRVGYFEAFALTCGADTTAADPCPDPVVVSRTAARTRFVGGQTVTVLLWLSASCRDVRCEGDLVCQCGACRSPDVGERCLDDVPPWGCCEEGGVPEVCNARDDDGDGEVDEGFDTATDPRHCGGCGSVCDLANAASACEAGRCVVASCDEGFGDCNADPTDGCEAALDASPDCGACGNACAGGAAGCADVMHPDGVTRRGCLEDVVEVRGGAGHTCARRASGEVRCSGSNSEGQLGDDMTHETCPGGTDCSSTPVVAIAAGATAVGAGTDHSCAVVGGDALCWGDAVLGRTGDGACGAPIRRPSAVDLSGGAATRMSVGNNTSCVLDGAGATWCWGGCNDPNCRGETTCRTPAVEPGLPPLAEVSVGSRHACGLDRAGGVHCWGVFDGADRAAAEVLPAGSARALASRGGRTCVALAAGGVACLSAGAWPPAPAPVPGVEEAVALAVGGDHACALRADGGVWCWGCNGEGQLGNGEMLDDPACAAPVAVPVRALLDAPVLSIDAGDAHTCAVAAGGDLFCWGDARAGKLGRPDDAACCPTPTRVTTF